MSGGQAGKAAAPGVIGLAAPGWLGRRLKSDTGGGDSDSVFVEDGDGGGGGLRCGGAEQGEEHPPRRHRVTENSFDHRTRRCARAGMVIRGLFYGRMRIGQGWFSEGEKDRKPHFLAAGDGVDTSGHSACKLCPRTTGKTGRFRRMGVFQKRRKKVKIPVRHRRTCFRCLS